jgi:hypothetical protein
VTDLAGAKTLSIGNSSQLFSFVRTEIEPDTFTRPFGVALKLSNVCSREEMFRVKGEEQMEKPLVTTEPLALIGYIVTRGLLEEQFDKEPRVARARDSRQDRVRRWTAYRVRAVADWLQPATAPCH